ncbi:MAG: hypothetical protein JO011_00640 [Ktedonobacteraceae bacterium]|nr:hypothetical protein [Ktedonobacteraceae bacterium]MBV9709400.1 hypothetical protein [Ktedonobacteraceae bacterium]
MNFAFLHPTAALVCIIAGLSFLYLCLFRSQWFAEGGFLRKKYFGNDTRTIYAMIAIFFVLGGLAFLLTK